MGKLQVEPSEQPSAQSTGLKAEEISLLMDGELDPEHADRACHGLREAGCVATWVCYHVIGDALRGTCELTPGFAERFRARLSVEPTILAPPRTKPRAVAVAWAAAATIAAVGVVGWVALQTMPAASPTIATAVATAREAAMIRAADARPSEVDNEYLIVHQEYSPTTAIQGVRPYLRAVAAEQNAR